MRARDISRFLKDMGWRSSPVVHSGAVHSPIAEAVDDDGPLTVLAHSAAACTLCRLSEKRHEVVFGEGDARAAVMFIGEGPGAEEDRTGRPFVGQAGQLLERMLFSIGLRRDQVYITNIVKCRPPGNRDPKEDEVAPLRPLSRSADRTHRPHGTGGPRQTGVEPAHGDLETHQRPARALDLLQGDPPDAGLPPRLPAPDRNREARGLGGPQEDQAALDSTERLIQPLSSRIFNSEFAAPALLRGSEVPALL